MEKWKKRAVELVASLGLGDGGSVVPYYPQKTEIPAPEQRYFRRSYPEAHGISSKRIFNMLAELEGEGRANVHNLILLSDGEVISEASREGYGVNIPHLSHSMAKTVVGMAVGIAEGEGVLSLEERLVDIFPELETRDRRFQALTVRDLLLMRSGSDFSEAGSVTEELWSRAFFRSGISSPVERFSYNSMNSYMLVRIIERKTGTDFDSYIDEKLFLPLGITNHFWERSREGSPKGGWGLFISAESWAKLGMLYLDGGVFMERRILPEGWVERSVSEVMKTPAFGGDFDYGYHLWVSEDKSEMLFNGMLGQNVWISRRNRIVAVIGCGNNELFRVSPALSIIRSHLSGEISDECSRRDLSALRKKEKQFFSSRRALIPPKPKRGFLELIGFRSREPYDERLDGILGEYRLTENRAGALPLFVRAMQSSIGDGIESIGIDRIGNAISVFFTEGGRKIEIPVGLYSYRSSVLDYKGEKYLIGALMTVSDGDLGNREYKLELIYPEMPNTLLITFSRRDMDRLLISFSELPDERIATALLERLPKSSPVLGIALELLEARYGRGFLQNKLHSIFHPTVTGVDVASADFDAIYRRECKAGGEESGTARLVRAIVARFFREAVDSPLSDEPEEEKTGERGSVFSRIASKLFGRRDGDSEKEK